MRVIWSRGARALVALLASGHGGAPHSGRRWWPGSAPRVPGDWGAMAWASWVAHVPACARGPKGARHESGRPCCWSERVGRGEVLGFARSWALAGALASWAGAKRAGRLGCWREEAKVRLGQGEEAVSWLGWRWWPANERALGLRGLLGPR